MSFSTDNLKDLVVWKVFSPEQEDLFKDGFTLLEAVDDKGLGHISDYSFLVAPFAKGYEGFLKDFFLERGLITKRERDSKRFRVGKVLNPNLKKKSYSVYAGLERFGEDGKILARALWRAWKLGRNRVFHYFHKNLHRLSLDEAKERIYLILKAIKMTGKVTG